MTAEPTSRPRRQVLCGLAVALLAPGAVVAACSSESDSGGSTGTTGNTGSTGSTGSTAASGGALAKVGDVPVGGGVLVDDGDRKLLLVQPKAGTVKAFDPRCPHQGVQVNPPNSGTIVCPGHGSTFDASTGALKTGPATTGLTEVPVKVSGGEVLAV